MHFLGIIFCSISVVWIIVRFLMTALASKYWQAPGLPRWHLTSGTLTTLLSPYFLNCLAIQKTSSLIIGTVSIIATAIVCITGIQLTAIIGDKDVPFTRNFIANSIGILVICSILAGLTALTGPTIPLISVSQLVIFLGLIVTLIAAFLVILEILSFFKPTTESSLELSHSIEKLSLVNIIDIFKLDKNSKTSFFSAGSKWVLFLATSAPILVAILATAMVCTNLLILIHLNSWKAFTTPINFYLTLLPYTSGIACWGVFEITLYLRGRSSARTALLSAMTTSLGQVGPYLLITTWFKTDFLSALSQFYFF